VYLLWNRELPNEAQLAECKRELVSNMEVPNEVIDHLKSYDVSKVHPMAALRTAVSLLGIYDEEADEMNPEANKRKAVGVQAKVATIVAAFSRIRQGKEPVMPNNEFGYAENFLYMLKDKRPEPIEIEAIDKALVLHADHELNASTFTARVCEATLSDVYSGVTSAISA